MKNRKEVAEYINSEEMVNKGKDANKNIHDWHIGLIELRNLMDFIYECEPKSEDENIVRIEK